MEAAETKENRKACLAQLKDFDSQRDKLIAALAGLDDTIDDDWDADFDFDEDRALTFADLLDKPDSPADPLPVLACTAQVQPIATTSVTADATPTPTAQVTGPARPSGTSAWFVPQEKAKQRDRFGRLLSKTRTPSGLTSAVLRCTVRRNSCGHDISAGAYGSIDLYRARVSLTHKLTFVTYQIGRASCRERV